MGNEIERQMKKIQFVSGENADVAILTPKGTINGFGEENLKKCSVGQIIHMPRIGFAKVDKIESGKVTLAFAHK